jgi:hypothetical protein
MTYFDVLSSSVSRLCSLLTEFVPTPSCQPNKLHGPQADAPITSNAVLSKEKNAQNAQSLAAI